MCGITFKENVPDIRNSKVVDIIHELEEFGISVDVWDPVAYPEEVEEEYGIKPVAQPMEGVYDGLVAAVKHQDFVISGVSVLRKLLKPSGVFFDVKDVFS